ncbi:TIGR01621 family pseudouridine synthase [Pseudidiomarina sp.]|uniref:TIGR01621 family pseudouridine synthase n=1 Tax=Pseudidiomarina sp. TaxID=2081707 RepID=UPI003A980F33
MRELTIVFHHPDFYVLDKPAGAPMHANNDEPSVVHQLSEHMNEPLWPVHRLDTPTSGALLVARNQAAAAALSELFAERAVQKFYLAISVGKPKKKQGLVSGDMQNVRRGNWRLLHTHDNPAQTRFMSYSLKPGYRYYVLKPITGRTHQLRVALKSLGVPICGDKRYGGEAAQYLHLHAWKLQFTYANTVIDVEVPWPAYEHFLDLPTTISTF